MRNKIIAYLAVLAVFSVFFQPAAATVIYPTPPPNSGTLFFGQNHSYSVVFRGNGEAIVFGKMIFTNTEESSLKNFTFTIPRVKPTEMVILQQKIKPVCVQYDYLKYDAATGQYPCLQYQELSKEFSEGYSYPYPGQPAEYQKVKYVENGGVYNLTLPAPIAPEKVGVILFSYAAFGYVNNRSGLFKFVFETPKVLSRINNLQVASDVDSDLFLKGKKSEVQYNIPSQEVFRSAAPAGQSLSSPALDTLSSNIGYSGPLMKQAKNLAPNESLVVKGEYASNKVRLYVDSIVWTLVVAAAIFFGIRQIRRYALKHRKTRPETNAVPQSDSLISILNFTNASMGFLSAVLVVVLTYILRVLSRADFFRFIEDEFTGILIVIMAGLLYVLVVFGPAILVGSKHGVKAGISVLITEFLWLILLLFLFVLLFKSGLSGGNDVYPMYRGGLY